MAIHTDAASRREAARASDGRFGAQHHTEAAVSLAGQAPATGTIAEGTAARDAAITRNRENIDHRATAIAELSGSEELAELRQREQQSLQALQPVITAHHEVSQARNETRTQIAAAAEGHYREAGVKYPRYVAGDILEAPDWERDDEGRLVFKVKRSGRDAKATRAAAETAAADERFQQLLAGEAEQTVAKNKLLAELNQARSAQQRTNRDLQLLEERLRGMESAQRVGKRFLAMTQALPEGFHPDTYQTASQYAGGTECTDRYGESYRDSALYVMPDGGTNAALWREDEGAWDRIMEPVESRDPGAGHQWRTASGRELFIGTRRENYRNREVNLDLTIALVKPEADWPATKRLRSSSSWDNS